MSLNTNFSNHNMHSNVSFQANFKTEIPVKNLERLANIKKIFSEKTQAYVNDTLTLSMSKDSSFAGYPILRTTDEISVEEYAYSHLAPNLDQLIQTMSDNQIAKKLIRFLKAMKKEEQIDNTMRQFDCKIEHLRAKRKQNLNNSDSCSNAGYSTLASQFRTIAESNQKKLEIFNSEKRKIAKIMINDLRKITEDDPNLKGIDKIYEEAFVK